MRKNVDPKIEIVRVPSHVDAICKAENSQTITEKLKISFFLKVFCNWLFVFCFAFCVHMGWHPEAENHKSERDTDIPLFLSHDFMICAFRFTLP